MAEGFNELELEAPAAPVLTFDAGPAPAPEAPKPVAVAEPKMTAQEEINLSPEEKLHINFDHLGHAIIPLDSPLLRV